MHFHLICYERCMMISANHGSFGCMSMLRLHQYPEVLHRIMILPRDTENLGKCFSVCRRMHLSESHGCLDDIYRLRAHFSFLCQVYYIARTAHRSNHSFFVIDPVLPKTEHLFLASVDRCTLTGVKYQKGSLSLFCRKYQSVSFHTYSWRSNFDNSRRLTVIPCYAHSVYQESLIPIWHFQNWGAEHSPASTPFLYLP